MILKDLIGHTIIDISDEVELLIKTDKGLYELTPYNLPDGTMINIYIKECSIETWKIYNGDTEEKIK